jgi:hypothetical protein
LDGARVNHEPLTIAIRVAIVLLAKAGRERLAAVEGSLDSSTNIGVTEGGRHVG